jgi:hypothetical protein
VRVPGPFQGWASVVAACGRRGPKRPGRTRVRVSSPTIMPGEPALAGAEQAHDGADCSSCGKASVSSRRSTSVSLVVPSVSGAAPHDLCRIGLAKQKRTVVKRGARIRSEAAGRTLAGLASALVVGGLLVVSPSRCGYEASDALSDRGMPFKASRCRSPRWTRGPIACTTDQFAAARAAILGSDRVGYLSSVARRLSS